MSEIKADRRSRAVTLLAVVLGIVIAANLLSRAAIGVFVHDQAELVVYSQDWRFAYDEQIPVYQWVVNVLLRITDYWVVSPDLFKYAWLIVAVVSLYKLGRKMTGTPTGGALAVFFSFLIPTMNEDLLREYTHSAALLAFTTASAVFFVSAGRERPRFDKWSPVLAAVWAGGMLSKHSMAIFIAAEIAAFWYVYRPPREELRALVKTALMALAMAAPVLVILVVNMAVVSEGAEEFLGGGSQLARFRGLADLASSIIAEGLLLFLAGAIGFFLAGGKAGTRTDPNVRLLLAANVIVVGIFFVAILITNAAVVRDRWLAPSLVLLGPVTARWFILGLKARTARILAVSLSVLLTIIGIERAIEPFLNRGSGKVEDENLPLRGIAQEVSKKAAPGEPVIATNPEVAATIKVVRPDLAVYSAWTIENLPETINEVLFVTTEKISRKPLDFPTDAWACGQPHEFHMPFFAVTTGTFEFDIRRCRRV